MAFALAAVMPVLAATWIALRLAVVPSAPRGSSAEPGRRIPASVAPVTPGVFISSIRRRP
jgi:hypothetical protein